MHTQDEEEHIEGVTNRSALERIARVITAWPLADGHQADGQAVSREVDSQWQQQLDLAAAILKTLREPDSHMAAVGDSAIWVRMVEAAIRGRARLDHADQPAAAVRDAKQAGGDDTRWSRRDERLDESFPASDPAPVNPGAD